MIKYVLKGKIGMMTRMTEFGPPVMLVIAVVSFVAILALSHGASWIATGLFPVLLEIEAVRIMRYNRRNGFEVVTES